jgi:hypothetical protein
MALIRNGKLVDDIYIDARTLDPVPIDRPVIVSLPQWQAHRDALLAGRAAAWHPPAERPAAGAAWRGSRSLRRCRPRVSQVP